MKPRYQDLYFGMSDSRNEVSESASTFVKSYVDLNGAASSIIDGRKFLVLGPKGTGKSALAWYLRAAGGNNQHIAEVRDASELPLAEVPRLQTGQSAGPERTVVAWKFILLCNYLELMLRDQSCSLNRDKEVVRVARLLRDFGFMGDTSGRALLKATNTTVTIPIPKLGELYRRESRPDINIYNLIPYLQDWVSTAAARLRHVLLIDGLDSIFLNDSKYDESLSSLVQAAYAINQHLQHHESTGSIALLLRNDVFARISLTLPDSQKMRDDLAFDLDWRVLSGEAGINAPLIRLVNTKASRAVGADDVRVLDYFPHHITVGKKSESGPRKIATLQYLLNMTRHTPRDLLRLFEEVRKVAAAETYGSPASDGSLADDVIHEGVLQYSAKYFVGAIRNEFAGYEGGPESAAAAMTALQAINKQAFDRAEFRSALADSGTEESIESDKLLRLLFYAGAIGNRVGNGSQSYMQFYHRRDESEIYLRGYFNLHHALIHAWGLSRSDRSDSADQTARDSRNSDSRRQRRRSRGGRPLPQPSTGQGDS